MTLTRLVVPPFSRDLATLATFAFAVLGNIAAASAAENCFVAAGAKYGRDPALYYAIAKVESNLNPLAVNESHIARTGTVDIGAMQINSGNLPALARRGITRERLLNEPCTNVDVGAAILEEKIALVGASWEAVGAYNAACTQLKGEACRKARQVYVDKVAKEYFKITGRNLTPPAGAHAATAPKRRTLRSIVEAPEHEQDRSAQDQELNHEE